MKAAIILAAAALASVAIAADPPAVAPVAAAPAAPEKKICRTLDPVIGSNLPRRSCKTRAEWAEQAKREQMTAQQKTDVEKFRDMSTQFAAPH